MNESKTVLVVDDDPEICDVVLRILQKRGILGWSERDPGKVLERVAKLRPDLVILDFDMPRYTGPEVAISIEASAAGRNIPIVFLSGMIEEDHHLIGAASGAVAYLNKPIHEPTLIDTIESILSSRSHGARSE